MTLVAILFVRQGQFPRSVLLLHPILTFLGVGWVRFGIRLVKSRLNMPRVGAEKYRRVLLIGAGDLGESLLRQMLKTKEPCYKVVGFIDDDRGMWGKRIHGLPVFGGVNILGSVLERHHVDEIVIAIGSRRGEVVRFVIDALRDLPAKPELKIAPSLDEMLSARHAGSSLRRVRPADLLNREVVKLDMARIENVLKGKSVLVTGAGGTIGSELSRRVLQYHPRKLVLIENHATSLFYAESTLREIAEGSEIIPVLGDIRDQALIDRVFREHRPEVVLHAAAHKHVHQLESNVQEGVGNNILGTYYVARAAHQHEAEVFLLVSTDKAVRPSCVMGATKRVAEFIVKSFAGRGGLTRFVAVRFGNVLGSSGSVLEIFQEQIARGGPITVTHQDVTRYFMTVEEAAQLILQAASMALGGEIFILKMGAPVKILEMAKNLILLSGLEPGKDIEIRMTGLKQGEKLDEELVEDAGDCGDSEHPSIMILRSGGAAVADIESRIMDLEILSRTAGSKTLVEKLQELTPTFVPAPAHRPSR
ncbi:MAG: polysaccharide biosynthesis protein [Elusimicrobia bacterium]|nr:polysaccharide biosynthesis protein [Elusimicrobiota bacterium]